MFCCCSNLIWWLRHCKRVSQWTYRRCLLPRQSKVSLPLSLFFAFTAFSCITGFLLFDSVHSVILSIHVPPLKDTSFLDVLPPQLQRREQFLAMVDDRRSFVPGLVTAFSGTHCSNHWNGSIVRSFWHCLGIVCMSVCSVCLSVFCFCLLAWQLISLVLCLSMSFFFSFCLSFSLLSFDCFFLLIGWSKIFYSTWWWWWWWSLFFGLSNAARDEARTADKWWCHSR